MRNEWRQGRTCYIDPSSSLDHSSTSFAFWLELLNRGSLRTQSPQSAAGSNSGILSPTDLNCLVTRLYYFLTSNCFLLPLFFRLFTQVHLLIDGSVEGQYITGCKTNTNVYVGWGCRIHWLHLCWGVKLPPNECPVYDNKLHLMVRLQSRISGECEYKCYQQTIHLKIIIYLDKEFGIE